MNDILMAFVFLVAALVLGLLLGIQIGSTGVRREAVDHGKAEWSNGFRWLP